MQEKKLKAIEKFNEEDWRRLDTRPQPSLYANFDYKANQFSDFYDLDTDNFDTDQQRMAQHLIGYQTREYLRNIINDDVGIDGALDSKHEDDISDNEHINLINDDNNIVLDVEIDEDEK